MAVEIKVPTLGESVTEATVAKWLVKAGDTVTIDQPLCELETDKVTVEVNAHGGRHHGRSCGRGGRHRAGGRRRCATSRPETGAAAAAPEAGRCPATARRSPAPAPAPAPSAAPVVAAGCGQRQHRRFTVRPRRKLVEETGVAPSAHPADRQGRPRHQGRRDGRPLVDPGAGGAAAAAKPAVPAGPRCARRPRGAGAHDAAAPHHRQSPRRRRRTRRPCSPPSTRWT